MAETCIKTRVDGGIAVITLDRPDVLNALNSVLMTEVSEAMKRFTAAWIFSGSWRGTSRRLTLATAVAGITVLAPAPVKPPPMPCTSRVGRAQMRSSTE